MSTIWATRGFLASCDVDLDLKVYVGALQLRSVRAGARGGRARFGGGVDGGVDSVGGFGVGGVGGGDGYGGGGGDDDADGEESFGASALSECALSLQVTDGGVPLHAFARSTGLCAAGEGALRGRVAFGEWVCLPVRVRDLPQTAQLVMRLWGRGNECLGGATMRVFDPQLALRRGLQVGVGGARRRRGPARNAARRCATLRDAARCCLALRVAVRRRATQSDAARRSATHRCDTPQHRPPAPAPSIPHALTPFPTRPLFSADRDLAQLVVAAARPA